MGPNFALGYKREGTIPVFRELGQELGFIVTVVEPAEAGESMISSTRVRELSPRGSVRRRASCWDVTPTSAASSCTAIIAGASWGFRPPTSRCRSAS